MPSNQLHQDGHVLTLFALKALESGTLTCTALNDFGIDTASVAVIFRNGTYSHAVTMRCRTAIKELFSCFLCLFLCVLFFADYFL